MGSRKPAASREGTARPVHAVSIEDSIHARLRELADLEGRKIKWLVQQALTEYLEREKGGADE